MFNNAEQSNAGQLKLDLRQMDTLKCGCGSVFFEQATVVKMASPIYTGYKTPMPVPVKIIRCEECKTVAEDLLPPEIGKFEDLIASPKKDIIDG